MYQDFLGLLLAEETLSALVRAYFTEDELRRAPVDPDDADAYVIVRTCVADIDADAANAALFRDLLGLLAQEGTYLVYAAFPERRALYETLGFEPVAATELYHWIADFPFQGYVLDLKRIGFEAWIEALMEGRRATRRPTADQLEADLTDLLPQLDDDGAVARSALGRRAGSADAVRRMVRAALVRPSRTRPRPTSSSRCERSSSRTSSGRRAMSAWPTGYRSRGRRSTGCSAAGAGRWPRSSAGAGG